MAQLTPEERKEAFQAFHKGAVLPLACSVVVGTGLNLLGPRTVASSAASLAIFVGGMILAVVLGLKRRRDTIAAIEARKQGSSERVADERL